MLGSGEPLLQRGEKTGETVVEQGDGVEP